MKTRKLIVKVVFAAVAIALVISGNVFSKDKPTALLWEVRPVNNSSHVLYLLGSIHYGRKDLYPLQKVIRSAWANSDVLGVEANINNTEDLQTEMLTFITQIMYVDGSLLKDHISSKTYNKIKNVLDSIGVDEEIYGRFTPLGVALLLQLGDNLRMMFDTTFQQQFLSGLTEGIDKHFLNLAETEHKDIVELESVSEQINLLANLVQTDNVDSEEYILSLLDKNVAFSSNPLEELDKLFTAWKNADIDALNAALNQPFSNDPKIDSTMKESLLYARNRKMASKIEQYITDNKTYFIVVGAGHLVGTKSVIDELQKTGRYKITQR